MIVRLFLALLALLTGIASAQSAVPISSAQSSIGVASPADVESSNLVVRRSVMVHFGAHLPSVTQRASRDNAVVPTYHAAIVAIAPTIFIGDRQRS